MFNQWLSWVVWNLLQLGWLKSRCSLNYLGLFVFVFVASFDGGELVSKLMRTSFRELAVILTNVAGVYEAYLYCLVSQQDAMVVCTNAMVDMSMEGCSVLDKFQFERLGYFCVDPDSTSQKVRMPLWRSLGEGQYEEHQLKKSEAATPKQRENWAGHCHIK